MYTYMWETVPSLITRPSHAFLMHVEKGKAWVQGMYMWFVYMFVGSYLANKIL